MTPRYLDLLDDLGVPGDVLRARRARATSIPSWSASTCGAAIRSPATATITSGSRSCRARRCSISASAPTTRSAGQPTGHSWVRPPHGSLDSLSLISLRAAGYMVAMWSLDSCDYTDRDPSVARRRCAPGPIERWRRAAVPRGPGVDARGAAADRHGAPRLGARVRDDARSVREVTGAKPAPLGSLTRPTSASSRSRGRPCGPAPKAARRTRSRRP